MTAPASRPGFGPRVTSLCLLAILPACQPEPAGPPSLADFRAAALAALGDPAQTIEFTASGWDACLGQAWAVTEGWARWELTDYRRIIDFGSGSSTQSAMRRAGLDPDRVGGCGGQVNAAASRQQTSIRPEAGFADKLPIALTPRGLLALADSGGTEACKRGKLTHRSR